MHRLTIWLKICTLILPLPVLSQSITLEQAYVKSRNNYPLIKQKDLIRQTAGLNINNLNKGFLPQLSINGQASYQSDVTKVDISVPGITINAPDKDQYKITADINQLVYDGGLTKQQKTLQELNANINDQQVEVELYKLKDRINQLYLGILLLEEQIKQVDLVKADIQTGIKKVEAQVQNGVAFRSNLNILKAEMIKNDQRIIELRSGRKALLETLGLFMGEEINDHVELIVPETVVPPLNILRPELTLYDNQLTALTQQNKLIHARNLPKTSLFVQGGYGRPGLNLLKNEFDLFYIGGVRFNWALGGLYTSKNDKRLVKLNQDIINTQKETFLLNTNTEIKKQQNEIQKLDELISTDNEIIDLRKSVTESSKAQLENGVITSSDYLREVNAEDQSRQNLILHQVQLIQAKINYKTITGQ
jgi:outer membrane protein TolC